MHFLYHGKVQMIRLNSRNVPVGLSINHTYLYFAQFWTDDYSASTARERPNIHKFSVEDSRSPRRWSFIKYPTVPSLHTHTLNNSYKWKWHHLSPSATMCKQEANADLLVRRSWMTLKKQWTNPRATETHSSEDAATTTTLITTQS